LIYGRDETGERTQNKARKRKAKRFPSLTLANNKMQISSVRFNDSFLVAGTSLPDQNLEDLQNLVIDKTIGVWPREMLEKAQAGNQVGFSRVL